MQVKFRQTRPEAAHIQSFIFDKPAGLNYTAGQFITLTVPHPNADDRGSRRWFTASSAPTEDYLSITTKLSQPGSSFKQALRQLSPGTPVEMFEPKGDFILPDDPSQPIVLVAGGIGVTPYRSMIKYLADTKQSRPIKLLYAVADANQIAFRSLFDTQAWLATNYLVAQPLDLKAIQSVSGRWQNQLIYLSGPESMVENLKDQLLAANLPENQLKTDFFPGYPSI
ncbi:FAD-dependent oxidoreductase [Candidatus Microgenomates bacterium]|nr:FAD-dependent oxidoreductase [Candidatus Microgenomates bacterium]